MKGNLIFFFFLDYAHLQHHIFLMQTPAGNKYTNKKHLTDNLELLYDQTNIVNAAVTNRGTRKIGNARPKNEDGSC